MSSALAIAGVTAVLRDLLNDGLINHNISGVLGSTVSVSVLPPDRVVAAGGGTEASQLNIFLHQVTPNAGWRNEGLPSRDFGGRYRLSNPPLALNLHYLISAYSGGDLHAEILLGYAMQLLHENPVFSRAAIQTALNPSPVNGDLPTALLALADSGLENQIEQIKITPEYLSTEDLSKLWSATLSNLRPTAAYMASVVLIEATQPVRSPLPVLTRGLRDPVTGREPGVVVEPSLVPSLPVIEAVVPPGEQPVARLGETIDLRGHHLDGTARSALLTNDRFEIEQSLPATGGSSPALLQFQIPVAQAADFPVGAYRVGARMLRPGEVNPRETNRLAMILAPHITGLPMNVARVAGTASFTINFRPTLRAGQQVTLVLGQQEFAPETFAPPVDALDFVIPDAPTGELLARLRIDGIDSPIIDKVAHPPVFLNQRIVIT